MPIASADAAPTNYDCGVIRRLIIRSTLSSAARCCFGTLVCMQLIGCGDHSDPNVKPVDPSVHAPARTGDSAPSQTGVAVTPWFIDAAETTGLVWQHTTGASGKYFFPEIAGSGCALFDFDGDGDLDVYLVQSFPLEMLEAAGLGGQIKGWKAEQGDVGMNRLFRNDLKVLPNGERVLRFVDVTESAGVGDRGYGMGCAVGDYDGDGHLDLFVTNFGPDVLYRNRGDGTFDDVSHLLPTDERWSSSAAFFDFDRDGDLDLFVVSYVNFSVRENKMCHSAGGRRDYCGPASFQPIMDRLYRNDGEAGFVDVTQAAGIDRAYGSGLGVVVADFDRDGWPDVFVANDGNANQLWMNRGDGTFDNTALVAGAAFNADGKPDAGMGVDAADFDLDGDEDVFISHLVGEKNMLSVNDGAGAYEDRSDRHGVGAMSLPYTGFGLRWFDYDHDGLLDLLIVNGAVQIAAHRAGAANPYAQPNNLLRNMGPPSFRFEDVSTQAGPELLREETSRGAAFGDIDNDGDIDILITNADGPVRLLRNDLGNRKSWLMLKLVASGRNRDAIGAVVNLLPNDDNERKTPVMRRVHSCGSYLSASDFRVHYGLGDDEAEQVLLVTWPDGARELFRGLAARREHVLRQGEGEAP